MRYACTLKVQVETDGCRSGSLQLLFQMGHDRHDPPCCPQCQGWKTRMRMNCRRSPLNQTTLMCTMSPNLTWCTQLWRVWRGLSAPGWKNRTGRSKVQWMTEQSYSAHTGITLCKNLSWIMKILMIFHIDLLNSPLCSQDRDHQSRKGSILVGSMGLWEGYFKLLDNISMVLHLHHHVCFLIKCWILRSLRIHMNL